MLIKFTAFALVGIIGTLAHYSVLYYLVEFRHFNPVTASGFGAIAGMLVNYFLNYRLTFKSKQPHSKTLPKFALFALIGLGLNQTLMAILTLRFYYLFAQILTTALILIWNFLANYFWTFESARTNSFTLKNHSNTLQKIFSGFGLLISIIAIRILTLGLYPLYDPSESRYAEMGRKMLETGNWVTPMIDYGVPFWGKPPLTVWLTAASLSVGGINDFSARLPSLLLGLGILWIIYYLANFQRGTDKAQSTIVILASSVLFFVMSGTVAMDQCMSLGTTLALASFWLALKDHRPIWGYLFFIGLSIGILAKGPIAMVLTGLTIGLWTLFSNQWLTIWKRIPWITGTLLMLCISIPWFLIAEQKTPGFLEYFIIGEHWKRFTESGWKGDLYGVGHAKMRGMIWLYWLGGAFPWSLLLLKSAISSIFHKQKISDLINLHDGWRLYCLLWMLAPLLFFSLSANIIWTYTLPALPGFALLLSDGLDQFKSRSITALCVPLAFLGIVIAYHIPGVEFYKSQEILVDAFLQQSDAEKQLIYVEDRPTSAQFYLEGKSLKLPKETAFQENSIHNYYVIREDIQKSLPNPIKIRLEPLKSYSIFGLYHLKLAKANG